MLRTPEQYVESLRDGRVVYQNGERVHDVASYPPYQDEIESRATEFYMAMQPEYRDLLNIMEDGEECSFAYHVMKTPEDLARRQQITQTLDRMGIRSTKFTGIDALNGVSYAAHKMDVEKGTDYGERIDNYRKWCQKQDPGISATMSDVKGNRALHAEDPRQKHKDFYLRIVDRTRDGIVISGCKCHISGAIVSNELLCMPSRNHDEPGKDYAVSCAVPCNAKGLTFIATDMEIDRGLGLGGGGSPMVVFDNVFVPNERVFLAGEWEFSRLFTTSFARYHRFSIISNRVSRIQQIAGLARLIAEYNGLTHATRIRDMLAWLAMFADMVEAMGKAAALDSKVDPEIGLAAPNEIYSNCAKFFCADNMHQAIKYLQDITGGIAATMPSWKDWENPKTRPYIEKYLGGDARYPTEERIRTLFKINEVASAPAGIAYLHAEGSPAAQQMMIYERADWERFKAAAKHSMGMKTDHPEFRDLPLPTEHLWKLPSK